MELLAESVPRLAVCDGWCAGIAQLVDATVHRLKITLSEVRSARRLDCAVLEPDAPGVVSNTRCLSDMAELG